MDTTGDGFACCTLPHMVMEFDPKGDVDSDGKLVTKLKGITIPTMQLKKVKVPVRTDQKGDEAAADWLEELDKAWCSTDPCTEEAFWRISPYTIDIFECNIPQACRRGAFNFNNSLPESGKYQRYESGCSQGYSGLLCENCVEGYFKRNIQGDCIHCDDILIDPQTLLGLSIFLLVGSLFAGVYFLPWFQAWYERNMVFIERISQQCTIIFVTWQIVSSLSSVHEHVGGAGYPDPFKEWSEAVEQILNFDLFDIVHPDCWGWNMGNITYQSKLMVYTIFPLGLIALGLLTRVVQKFAFGEKNFLGGKAMEWPLTFFFLCLPAISKIICSANRCVPFVDGVSKEVEDQYTTSFMSADLTIQCYHEGKMTATYESIMTYSILMAFILPIGGTLSMLVLLWKYKELINNREFQEGDDEISFLKVWFLQYDPIYWWYGIFDMVRRFTFTSALMFVNGSDGGRGTQILIALILSLCQVLVLRETGPYWDAPLDYLAYFCAWQVVLGTICLLLMDAASGEPIQVHPLVLSILLLAVNACILGTSVNFSCGKGQELYDNEVDAAEYSMTRNLATGFGTSVPTVRGSSRRRTAAGKGVLGNGGLEKSSSGGGNGFASERSGGSASSRRGSKKITAKVAPGNDEIEESEQPPRLGAAMVVAAVAPASSDSNSAIEVAPASSDSNSAIEE